MAEPTAILGRHGKKGRRHSRFVQADFEKLPIAIQRQILMLQIIEFDITPDFELVESIRLSPHKPVALDPGISLLRDAQGQLSQRELQTAAFDECSMSVNLRTPGLALFAGLKLKWKFLRGARIEPSLVALPPGSARVPRVVKHAGTELFDANRVGEEIVLRHWRAGDRFQPIGLQSAAKLQDLFTNAKIPREQRHGLVVAEAAGGVFWVQGFRISENFKLTAQTKRILVWNWRRHEQL